MKTQRKISKGAAARLAQAHHDDPEASLEWLMREAELGLMSDRPFTLSIRFNRLEQLVKMARAIAPVGYEVYKADVLDPEFKGSAPLNSFVVRDPESNHGKSEDARVS